MCVYNHFNDIQHFVFLMAIIENPLQFTIFDLGSLQSTMALAPTAPHLRCTRSSPRSVHLLLPSPRDNPPSPADPEKQRLAKEVKCEEMSPPCDFFVNQQNGSKWRVFHPWIGIKPGKFAGEIWVVKIGYQIPTSHMSICTEIFSKNTFQKRNLRASKPENADSTHIHKNIW